jgi:hypothetical protein
VPIDSPPNKLESDSQTKDIVWLDELININKKPPLTQVRLRGVYKHTDDKATITLIIVHDGTEYRVVRYHKPVSSALPATKERLLRRHRNMVNHFLNMHDNESWDKIRDKFLSWNRNPTYAHVISNI